MVNCCLDISTSTKLSCILANLILDFDDQKQTFIIQNLISVCCRCYQPKLCGKIQQDDALYNVKYDLCVQETQNVSEDMCALDLLNSGVTKVFAMSENNDTLVYYLNFLNVDFKKLKKRKAVKG